MRRSDRRALFIGIEAYETAGGVVMRDLFQHDDGGWLQDPALLDRLVTEKLQAEAEALRDEGWKWISVATDFPYGHSAGLRRLAVADRGFRCAPGDRTAGAELAASSISADRDGETWTRLIL